MRLMVAGVEYKDFISADASFRMDTLSDTFSFEATSTNLVPLPFRGGEPCTIFVDGTEVLNGHIELVNVDGDEDSHVIAIQGRDRTGDLLDSTLGELADIKVADETSLKEVVQAVLKHLGLDKTRVGAGNNPTEPPITVTQSVAVEPFTEAEDIFASKSGESAADFLFKAARKRQVFIVSTVKGNLDIIRSSGVVSPGAFLQHLKVSPKLQANNVLSYSYSWDETGRFNLYKNSTQPNAMSWVKQLIEINNKALAGTGGLTPSVDQTIRAGRQWVMTAEATNSAKTDFNRANWEMRIREARGRTYGATVHGYRNQSGDLWTPNTLVQVVDEYAGIDSPMLINGVTFSFDISAGSITRLTLVERDAYKISQEEVLRETDVAGSELDKKFKQLDKLKKAALEAVRKVLGSDE